MKFFNPSTTSSDQDENQVVSSVAKMPKPTDRAHDIKAAGRKYAEKVMYAEMIVAQQHQLRR